MYRIFLNFAKSYISSCLSKFYNKSFFVEEYWPWVGGIANVLVQMPGALWGLPPGWLLINKCITKMHASAE